jgi:hypothetical protein
VCAARPGAYRDGSGSIPGASTSAQQVRTAAIEDPLQVGVHGNPRKASWINLVERWFALLTERQLRRGAHRSTHELERAIKDFLDVHNADPKPFVWTKTADQILESLGRFCRRISDSGH